MKDEDLAPFAVADGLIAKMTTEATWHLTNPEQDYLLERARENLAKATGETLDAAGDAMAEAFEEGHFAIQASHEFACVTMHRRVLFAISRRELAGLCHPERN
jgi:hypothetical protein